MDLLIKKGDELAPKDHAEEVAIFRAQVIGPLLTREFTWVQLEPDPGAGELRG